MRKYINDIYSAPVYHWLMFLRFNNLGFMLTKSIDTPINKVAPVYTEESVNTYHDINDQIIKDFGFNESFLAHKKNEQEIAFLKLDYIINGNKFNRTKWKLKEASVIPLKDNEDVHDFNREIALISKNIGVGMIDIKKFTIHQYLNAKNG